MHIEWYPFKITVCDILENIFLNIKTETYQIDPQQS